MSVSHSIKVTKTIELTVAYVRSGGNTGRGQYMFDFDENSIMLKHAQGVVLAFVLSPDTAPQFRIHSMVSSNPELLQIDPIRSPDHRSIGVENKFTVPCLVTVAILVHDVERDQLIVCDPQVLHIPD
jgi:hypothetical protein